MMGAERRSMILTEEDKAVTAWHEAGHALVAVLLPEADPLHKVSIIPRGRALGVTMQLPEGDVLNRTEKQLQARLCVLMAGRIAEMKHTHELSTGASNDIEQATEVARAMVCDYGMSRLGPMSYGKKDEQIFLGREIAQHRDYSEATAIQIDQAVRMMVESAFQRAEGMIEEYGWALEKIAAALLERETMDGEEVSAIIERREVRRGPRPGSAVSPPPDETQVVIKPEPDDRSVGRGFVDGESPAPA